MDKLIELLVISVVFLLVLGAFIGVSSGAVFYLWPLSGLAAMTGISLTYLHCVGIVSLLVVLKALIH